MRKDIQKIIDGKLQKIIDLINGELPRWEPEPDYVILRELRIYFEK